MSFVPIVADGYDGCADKNAAPARGSIEIVLGSTVVRIAGGDRRTVETILRVLAQR